MTQEADELLKRALALPIKDRADLAGLLIDSLDSTVDAGIEEAWNEEITRRLEEIDSGKVKPVSWEEVRRRTLAKFNRGQ